MIVEIEAINDLTKKTFVPWSESKISNRSKKSACDVAPRPKTKNENDW